ncbi:MAG: hypothetical protein ABI413_07205 [Ktedonobacteraceae bacterium]
MKTDVREQVLRIPMPSFPPKTTFIPTLIEKHVPPGMENQGHMLYSAAGMYRPAIQNLSVLPSFLKEEDDALAFQTVSMRVVKKIQRKKKVKSFLAGLVIFLLNILFLGILVAFIIELPGLVYKVATIVVFIIALSYVASVQMKRIDQAHYKKALTETQFLRAIKKRSNSSHDKDMQHMKLIKEDTMTYLHALTKKELRKGSRS